MSKKRPAVVDPNTGQPKPPEPKDAKFRRLADRRVNVALTKISYIKGLASRSSYLYTDEQAASIVHALQRAVEEVASAFAGGLKIKPTFQLPG